MSDHSDRKLPPDPRGPDCDESGESDEIVGSVTDWSAVKSSRSLPLMVCGPELDPFTRFRSGSGTTCPECRCLLGEGLPKKLPDHVGEWVASESCEIWVRWMTRMCDVAPSVLILPDRTAVQVSDYGELFVERPGLYGETVRTRIALVLREFVGAADSGYTMPDVYASDPRYRGLRSELCGESDQAPAWLKGWGFSGAEKLEVVKQAVTDRASARGLTENPGVAEALAAEAYPEIARRAGYRRDARVSRAVPVTYLLELWPPEYDADNAFVRQFGHVHCILSYQGGSRSLELVAGRYQKIADWAQNVLKITLVRLDRLVSAEHGVPRKSDDLNKILDRYELGEITKEQCLDEAREQFIADKKKQHLKAERTRFIADWSAKHNRLPGPEDIDAFMARESGKHGGLPSPVAIAKYMSDTVGGRMRNRARKRSRDSTS